MSREGRYNANFICLHIFYYQGVEENNNDHLKPRPPAGNYQSKPTPPAVTPSQAETLVAGLEDLRFDLRFLRSSTLGKSRFYASPWTEPVDEGYFLRPADFVELQRERHKALEDGLALFKEQANATMTNLDEDLKSLAENTSRTDKEARKKFLLVKGENKSSWPIRVDRRRNFLQRTYRNSGSVWESWEASEGRTLATTQATIGGSRLLRSTKKITSSWSWDHVRQTVRLL